MKSQKSSQRQQDILAKLRESGALDVAGLAEALNVSEETIRRDAKFLQDQGDILKTHGALSLPVYHGEAPFDKRLRENSNSKRAIARLAVKLIQDGESLMIDTGTTTSIFAQELRIKRGLTVVTNSSDIARTLATVNGNKVYMAGGELKADSGAAFGPSAVEFISKFRVKHAFISTTAIDIKLGVMDMELEEAELAQMAFRNAQHRVVLSDSTKFGKTGLVRVCGFNEFDRLVTDALPEEAMKQALMQAGVAIDVAGGS